MIAWNVYLDGKLIDTVFFTDNCSAEYVEDSLINNDHYDAAIIVKEQENE